MLVALDLCPIEVNPNCTNPSYVHEFQSFWNYCQPHFSNDCHPRI